MNEWSHVGRYNHVKCKHIWSCTGEMVYVWYNSMTFFIYDGDKHFYSLGPVPYEIFTRYVGELMSMQPKLSEKVARDRPFSFLCLVIRVIWPSSSCEHVISV